MTPRTRLVVASHVPVDDRRGPAGRRARRARPRPGRAVRRRRRAERRGDPGRLRGDRGRCLRDRRAEVAARAGGDGRPGRPPGRGRPAAPGLRRLPELRDASTRWAPRSSTPTRGGSSGGPSIGPRSSGMARSISWLSMFVGPRLDLRSRDRHGPACGRATGGDPRRDRADPGPPDGDARDLPDRGLGRSGRPGRAGCPRVRHRPHDRRARCPAHQRRVLQLRRGAGAVRRGRRAARGAHAGDDPAAPDPDDRSVA